MNFILVQVFNGLSHAASLFLIAAGLTLVFGVTRIANFAHGSFAMLGAYIASTLMNRADALGAGPWAYYGALLAAALVAGGIGLIVERVVLRRVMGATELFQLLATFGVVLVVQDVALRAWGPQDIFAPRAPGLGGSVALFGQAVPVWNLAMIATMPVIWAALHWALRRTRWGARVRAATQDREMASALGVNEGAMFASTMFVGAALAGLGGALQLPTSTVNLQMDLNLVVEAFVVVVIGGMGSVTGALVGSVLIGELAAFGAWLIPQATLVLTFAAMAAVLVLRPAGLLGHVQAPIDRGFVAADRPLGERSRSATAAAMIAFALLAVWPFVVGDFARDLVVEMMLLALFALSLQWLIGQGGLVSFGHAAFFGLGAYGAAFAVRDFAAPWAIALLSGAALAMLGAIVFAAVALRSAGVYFAMLSLAFAQILWSTAVQWVSLSGGDNGVLGLRGAASLGGSGFYFVAFGLFVACFGFVLQLGRSPFGFRVRALRDHAVRAESLGIAPFSTRAIVLAVSGALAGLAGGAMALHKGAVFPDALSISTSIDGLVMVLLGGVQSAVGTVAGAFGYQGAMSELVRRFDAWRLLLGLMIIAVVVVAPGGFAQAVRRWSRGVR